MTSKLLDVARDSAVADRYWTAIQTALRRNRFTLDRVDRKRGVITTMPVTSQHFLEFWRQDVVTAYDAWESTLCPIRRWVEVSIAQRADGAWGEMQVVVHKERLSSPDRQFNNSGAAYQVFGNSLPSTTGDRFVPDDEVHWIGLGRDAAMEEFLLQRIAALAAEEFNEAAWQSSKDG